MHCYVKNVQVGVTTHCILVCRHIAKFLPFFYLKLCESESEIAQSCPTLCDPMDCPSMGFSRQEYWSGLPFPSPEDLPDPGIEPGSPAL